MAMRNSLVFLWLLLLGTLMVCTAEMAWAITVPQFAAGAGRDLDRQMAQALGLGEPPVQGVSITVTTPVDINDLSVSNALARQMQEEISGWFTQAGYDVREIRKGGEVLFEEYNGERLLTRDAEKLPTRQVKSATIVTGTYTVTPRNVRFNFRVMETASQRVFAMSSVTVPITAETSSLVFGSGGGAGGIPIEPTVVTRLP